MMHSAVRQQHNSGMREAMVADGKGGKQLGPGVRQGLRRRHRRAASEAGRRRLGPAMAGGGGRERGSRAVRGMGFAKAGGIGVE